MKAAIGDIPSELPDSGGSSSLQELVTWGLALVATAAVASAVGSGSAIEWPLVIALALLIRLILRARGTLTSSRLMIPIILITFAWPLLSVWSNSRVARPLDDGLLIACFRVLWMQAAVAAGRRERALVAVTALFLTVASTTRVETRFLAPIIAAFALLGCAWLGATHAASHARAGRPLRRTPISAVFTAGVCCLIGLYPVFRDRMTALRGWLPSSGGAERASDLAASGIGDGPDQVAGSTNAQSVGFDQCDVFMYSQHGGLYDAFLEVYGEPVKKGESAKMQMLRIEEFGHARSTGIEDYRIGREFSLQRQPPPRGRDALPDSHNSQAMLVVDGSLPQHIRTVAYDTFDGTRWTASSDGWPGWTLQQTESPNWFKPRPDSYSDRYGAPPFSGEHVVTVRVGTLQSQTLPIPTGFDRLHIGRVTRLSLFDFKHPDLLEMTDRIVPVGTVIDSVCGDFDAKKLTVWSWGAAQPTRSDAYASAQSVQRLARSWTHGLEFGWPQIAAIIGHLQSEYELTEAKEIPTAGQADPLAVFLTQSHRGPDYLFASATAAMLQSLGYSARVAGGFYAGPGDYDATIKQTPLNARQMHMWAEVAAGGRWLVVESCPGYFIAGSRPSVLGGFGRNVWAIVRAHWLASGLIVLALIRCFQKRVLLYDTIITLSTRLRPARDWSARVIRTTELIERRAHLAGIPRHPAMTRSRWLCAANLACDARHRGALIRLAAAVEWSAFASKDPSASMAGDIDEACGELERHVTADQMEKIQRAAGFRRSESK